MNTAQITIPSARPGYWRLAGTKGVLAAVGQISEIREGNACWNLHPAYAAWFWPLMLKATALALLVPEKLLEPAGEGETNTAPRAPTDVEKDVILKTPESAKDAIRVYTLVLKGKQPSVHKAFPTRNVSLAALKYCRTQISKDVPVQAEPAAKA